MKQSFFDKPTVSLANSLLGCYLLHKTSKGDILGKIVETEAYLKDDPACHAYSGITSRNKAMFGKPGTAYVYFTYGMHYCFNVVSNKPGTGEAILIRALEPIEGKDIMILNRGINDIRNLCNGPAKLTQAFNINLSHNGLDLTKGNLKIIPKNSGRFKIRVSKRIGVSRAENLPLRFFISGNPFVSRTLP